MLCKDCSKKVTSALENFTIDCSKAQRVPDHLIKTMKDYFQSKNLKSSEFCSNNCLNHYLYQDFKNYFVGQVELEKAMNLDEIMTPLNGSPGLDHDKIRRNREVFIAFLDSKIDQYTPE